MKNNRHLPYETIVQAASGEPEAVGTVLQYYRRFADNQKAVNLTDLLLFSFSFDVFENPQYEKSKKENSYFVWQIPGLSVEGD